MTAVTPPKKIFEIVDFFSRRGRIGSGSVRHVAEPPILTLRFGRIGFGGAPLFENAELRLGRGDRACLVGRNGSGKTTLMKALAGLIELDEGEVFVQPGTRIAYLPQDPEIDRDMTVAAHVGAEGHAAHLVDAAMNEAQIDGARQMGELSGGELRRASLARALVGDPEILFLDEPTNHLDLAAIEWLERLLTSRNGALLLVSHDRTFLERVTNRTYWLDRRAIRFRTHGFAGFDKWSEQVLAEEVKAAERLDVKLAEETRWLLRGITARRRRNQGRLRKLEEMRERRAAMLGGRGKLRLKIDEGEIKSKLVIEAKDVAKSFGEGEDELPIVRSFSTRILRGDRIGIIGPNGAGKTTLLRLLTGELEPDGGKVWIAKHLNRAYFDQNRETLDPVKSLWETLCPGGGDQVFVHGRPRHVRAYLKDFLFDPTAADSPVSSLSGGERNRLLLAKILTTPSELLVLDEPTNDLDMDTLDLLQDVLADYGGTLILVSHDRDFLDRTVTSTIALEGDGRAREYPGGYADYLRQRKDERPRGKAAGKPSATSAASKPRKSPQPRTRLTYKDQRELDLLPGRIAKLENEIKELDAKLSDNTLFERDRASFDRAATRLQAARAELAAAEARWLELEERKDALAAQ
jgi:ABC transport system ATP-binding/permease protein